MGIPGSANPMLFGGAAAYQINQSLRFNRSDSPYLEKTFSSAGNRRTQTWSFWVKRTSLSGGSYGTFLVEADAGGSSKDSIAFNTSDELSMPFGDGVSGNIRTSALFRDFSAWYHIVIAFDTTQATASNRIKVYVNGTQVTNFSSASYVSQNYDLQLGSNVVHNIGDRGASGASGTNHFDGYMAEFNFVDGQQLTPSSFGETDTITGAWIPKKYSGSYGTNGFYLKFESSGIGTDSSGNGNTWTANNFSTSGTGTDVMSDTPTNNWCTLNPAFKNINTGNTYTEGNLVATNGTGAYSFIFNSTVPVSSGKWYAECTMSGYSGTPSPVIGIQDAGNKADVGNELVGAETGGVGYSIRDGSIYKDGNYSFATGYTTATSGDVIGIKLDLDGNTIEFLKNNTSVGAAVAVATGTGLKIFAGGQGDGSNGIGCTFTWNFGQRSFSYTPPTGYKALNTANLPEPTIKKGDKYFDTKLYTGTGGSQSLSGLGFQPDLVWIKARSTASSHGLYDAVRGVGQVLLSNSTSAEQNYGSYGVTSFNSAGFSVNDLPGYGVNDSGQTYAAWCWDANGAGSSNTAGTITSTVSANATAGFSIVTYTSPNSASDQTVGHGLGVKPSLIIVKNRDSSFNWDIYHASLGYNASLIFTSAGTRSGAFGAEPTSTVFTTKTNYTHNSTNTYVAYCFSEVAGYSRISSYVGNGSSDGPFVFCNFRPAWIMIKDSTGSGNSWYISDNKRNTYNVVNGRLMANLSNDESTSVSICDFTSNGFKIRTSDSGWNTSSSTYIFAAFSETAFKFANAR